MRIVFSLLIALAAAGCTPMAYQKAGVTTTQATTDEQDCRSLAAREAMPMGWGWRSYGWRRGYPFGYFGDPLLGRMHEESGLSDFCMRARGYELKALPTPS